MRTELAVRLGLGIAVTVVCVAASLTVTDARMWSPPGAAVVSPAAIAVVANGSSFCGANGQFFTTNCTANITATAGSALVFFAYNPNLFLRQPAFAGLVGGPRATYYSNASTINQGAVFSYVVGEAAGGAATVYTNYTSDISAFILVLDVTGAGTSPVVDQGPASTGNSTTASAAVTTTVAGEVAIVGMLAVQHKSVGGFTISATGGDTLEAGGSPQFDTGNFEGAGTKGYYVPTTLAEAPASVGSVTLQGALKAGAPVSYAWNAVALGLSPSATTVLNPPIGGGGSSAGLPCTETRLTWVNAPGPVGASLVNVSLRVYDASGNLVANLSLGANGGATVVGKLLCATSYTFTVRDWYSTGPPGPVSGAFAFFTGAFPAAASVSSLGRWLPEIILGLGLLLLALIVAALISYGSRRRR